MEKKKFFFLFFLQRRNYAWFSGNSISIISKILFFLHLPSEPYYSCSKGKELSSEDFKSPVVFANFEPFPQVIFIFFFPTQLFPEHLAWQAICLSFSLKSPSSESHVTKLCHSSSPRWNHLQSPGHFLIPSVF